MTEFQGGLCAICTNPMEPGHGTHIDHCHVSGETRMLLCGKCNTMLGMAGDSEAVLLGAIEYLRIFKPS